MWIEMWSNNTEITLQFTRMTRDVNNLHFALHEGPCLLPLKKLWETGNDLAISIVIHRCLPLLAIVS